jgi:putative phosphoesterase
VDLLGILSDTHGRTDRARRAIDALLAAGATRIVHLGDVGSESVLDLLAGLPALVVFGNCDDERALARYADHLGIEVAHPATIIEVKSTSRADGGAIRLGLTHGHLEGEVARLLDARVDVLLHGHTHAVRDEQCGPTRILNPGALHRAIRHTALLLDTATLEARWIDVDDETAA